jgi:hypothetical protein
MSTLTKYGLVLLAGIAVGYGLMPKKIETKTVTVESKQTDIDRNKHKQTTTTEVVKPDGTKTIVTQITENTDTQKKVSDKKSSESETTITVGSEVSVNVLAGTRFNVGEPIDFGISVDKRVLGPIKLGAFAFKSGMVGLSLGIQF